MARLTMARCLVYIFALFVLITTFASESDDTIPPQWSRASHRNRMIALNRMKARMKGLGRWRRSRWGRWGGKRRTPPRPTTTTTTTTKKTRTTLTLFWFRHVESDWNCRKDPTTDSGISETGKDECIEIAKNFGRGIFREFDQILTDAGDSRAFHFEASTLRRTQLTVLPAWRSLLLQAQLVRHKADRVTGLENADFYIMEFLQEASANVDAISLFDDKVLKPNNVRTSQMNQGEKSEKLKTKGGDDLLGAWETYLKAGWGRDMYKKYKNKDVFGSIFKNSGFDAVWGKNAYYVEGEKYERVKAMMGKKYERIEHYGKWLRRQMNNDVALIIVAGHSKWFQYFVDKMKATDMKTDGKYGEDGDKVPNGDMVRVDVAAYGRDSIRIKSITKKFINPVESCEVGLELAHEFIPPKVVETVDKGIKTVKGAGNKIKKGWNKLWGAKMDYDNEIRLWDEYDDDYNHYMMNDEYFDDMDYLDDDVLEQMDLEELNELYDALDELNDKYEEYGGETEE